jgi:glycosyltransferase involved in cell wall biosynthesis
MKQAVQIVDHIARSDNTGSAGQLTLTPPKANSRINQPERILVAKVCAIDLSVKALLKPQIEALKSAGYDVVTVCSDGESVAELRAGGLEIETIRITRQITPLADALAIWRLYRFFRNRRPAIVHTHTPKAAFVAQVAAALARVPIRINTIHGYYFPAARGLRSWLFKKMEVLTCKLSHHVFSQSREDVDLTFRENLFAASKIELLGNGTDISRFNPAQHSKADREAIRAELNIPTDAFVVGIVARMVREKGFAELFEAFAEFRRQAPDAFLLHVGFVDRSRGDEVTPDLAEQFGIAAYCRFVGQRDDVSRLLSAMDVFCLPSYREGYPRSVLEANAMGLPAIVTNIRGCREAVVDGQNGLLVEPRQVVPLAGAMRKLHDDPELRTRMSRAARARAVEVFDERLVFDRIIRRYTLLAGNAVGAMEQRSGPQATPRT